MNAYLNYLLEASIGLCLFLVVYQLFLRNETSFRLNRIFLLLAVIASITFPLFNFNTPESPVPSLSFSAEPITTLASSDPVETIVEKPSMTIWEIFAIIYAIGFALFLIVFAFRLSRIFSVLKKSVQYTINHHRIVELKSNDSPFSFFNYVFIGNTPPLTETEKQQIIEHESIHAKLYHSFDIVLLNIVGIIFWFNPLIRVYKKIFVQLHEFEADARAVETHDVDEYCSLLAKVALHSADYKLVNHFSNSLTVKRINMMRTFKHKIKSWRVVAATAIIPIVFFVVACQDQADPSAEVREEFIQYPVSVQQKIKELSAKFPGGTPKGVFTVLGPSKTGPRLEKTDPDSSNMIIRFEDKTYPTGPFHIVMDKNKKGETVIYTILEPRIVTKFSPPIESGEVAEVAFDEPVFSAVDQQAEFPGGMDGLKKFLKSNVRYPDKAPGIAGKVFFQFTIDKEGNLSDFTLIKGVSAELDNEALRVMKLMPKWNPGKQNGKPVNSRFVLPITFGIENPVEQQPVQITELLQVDYKRKIVGDKIEVTGTVKDAEGNPLPGAHVIIDGGTKGTPTDSEGNFKLLVPAGTKRLAASFQGFEIKLLEL